MKGINFAILLNLFFAVANMSVYLFWTHMWYSLAVSLFNFAVVAFLINIRNGMK